MLSMKKKSRNHSGHVSSVLDKIHQKNSEEFLKYGILIELMLSKYEGAKFLSDFSPSLLSKHRNLLNEWKKINKDHFLHVEKNYPELIEEYYAQIEYFERLFSLDWTKVSFKETNNRQKDRDTEAVGYNRLGGIQGSEDSPEAN
jgi:hypothetical protein